MPTGVAHPIDTLAVVGVGLIGGSVALAARRRGLAARVVGADQNAQTLQTSLARGILDEAAAGIEEAARRADVVVFCTPVDRVASQVRVAAAACRPGTLLMDAGSTKAEIVRDLDDLPGAAPFVGCHPLAGSEKSGPEHARADLFDSALVVVTPGDRTLAEALARARDFWHGLGAHTRLMSPEEHDRALALTSHLPHLAASALAGIVPPLWLPLTASGFRDATRLAAGDPALWAAIFHANRDALLDALDKLGEQLDSFRHALQADDRSRTETLLGQGFAQRAALGRSPDPSGE
jgi:cyclohexadieny/prephenate dehydrogenase